MVQDILLSGIYDVEIRREVLADSSMVDKPINNIIGTIKSKESLRTAVAASVPRAPAKAAAASSFKSQGKPSAAAAKSPISQSYSAAATTSSQFSHTTPQRDASPLALRLRQILRRLCSVPVRHTLQGVPPQE